MNTQLPGKPSLCPTCQEGEIDGDESALGALTSTLEMYPWQSKSVPAALFS